MNSLRKWLRSTTQQWRRKLIFACLPRGLYFAKLGQLGRLGNQLFQYATLRTLAERLGTRYYCPAWAGDDLFDLADPRRLNMSLAFNVPDHLWLEPTDDLDQTSIALQQQYRGKANLNGHPEAEHLFDTAATRRWFQLRPEWAQIIEQRYSGLALEDTVSLHVRLRPPLNIKDKVVCQLPYYRAALARSDCPNVLVFSDDLPAARAMLEPITNERNFIFQGEPNEKLPEQLRDYEDIHLMSLCRDNIICVSTYSWWGAWLNTKPGRRVICPTPWFQYGCGREFPSPALSDWTLLHADGEQSKQLVIEPRGTASERRAVIISAQIWAEHLSRELRVVWRRDAQCDLPFHDALPLCTAAHAPDNYSPAMPGVLYYSHDDLRRETGVVSSSIVDPEPLALPSRLAGYEPTIHLETSASFRPVWMRTEEYRAEFLRWESALFASRPARASVARAA